MIINFQIHIQLLHMYRYSGWMTELEVSDFENKAIKK